MHLTTALSYSTDKSHQNIGLPYTNKGFMVAVGTATGKDGLPHNMGIYLKFTAPVSGYASLNLNKLAQVNGGCKVVIIKNDLVCSAFESIPLNTTVDLGFINKGETVSVCYGTDSNKIFYNYGGSPEIAITGERVSLKLADNTEYLFASGEKFRLPDISMESGKVLLGWRNSLEKEYSGGSEYIVTENNILTENNCYYGDITVDGSIDATDMSCMRFGLLENSELNTNVCDINSDSSFNAVDIVRFKKWLAGYTVPFNVK